MKYKDLIQFEPINEIVKFNRLDDVDYRRSLVRNFVFSKAYEKNFIPAICKNLDFTASHDTFGIQIVGSYGTGKSHLMSLISLVAEDDSFISDINNESSKKVLSNIAGKYKVIRFELGTDDELWRVVCFQIDKAFKQWGINYSISEDNTPDMYSDKLNRMVAHFGQVFPGKGLMIVIDEMLSYLKGRSGAASLNRDLAVLQALGQASDHSMFRMIFGVQELIYNAPEFAFAAEMLNKVNDRYKDITITKQDVQFVVQQRLLSKTDQQKNIIRQHLGKFTEFFTDMHANLEDYVNLFPVNPSFFENFQQIRIGKSQREVLKTLTHKFEEIFNQDVPESEPGLICYDSYWEDLNVADMQTIADVRRVSVIMETIHQKIDENFTGARASKARLAHRIANACAVKILQDTLEHTNGVSAENLIDDLCYLDTMCIDREMLGDIINTTASQIVSATVGQYFEKNDQNQEYHLRIEGGVNYEQKIKDFALTMSDDNKDQHFFNYLVEYLPIEVEQYRREFKIFKHRIDWKSHKTMLDGYIFMGNPSERSTTHPEQHFYIYFMPIFNRANMQHGDEADSIYVHLDKVSDEMKELISLYASAEALIKSVDSSQKRFYEDFKRRYEEKLRPVFQRDFMQCTEIYYQGELQTVVMTSGDSKEQIISDIASNLLEDYFCQALPDYPKFSLLRMPMTSENRAGMIKAAKTKIAKPTLPNRDGEAILAGLGLISDGQINIDASQYAQSIKQHLENKGEGQVLNRDEIIYQYFEQIWRTKDFEIEADLEFLVLCAMVAIGEIEINLPGNKNINAANIAEIIELTPDVCYAFSHVRKPRGMNVALVREIFIRITGHDLTSQMQNPETYTKLLSNAQKLAARAATLKQRIYNGIFLDNVEIVSRMDTMSFTNWLDALTGLCDRLQNYGTQAKMRNLPWTLEQLKPIFETIPLIDEYNDILKTVDELRGRISYITQARQYMTSADMKKKVDDALEMIKDIASMMKDEHKLNDYKALLDSIAGEYADWYLAEYKRLHITGIEETEKNRIIRSQQKLVCDTICGADRGGYITIATQYRDWERRMAQLTVANPGVTREAVLRTPYHAFNPVQFEGKSLPKIGDMKEELDTIHGSILKSLSEMVNDQQLLDNVDAVLDASEKRLLNQFKADDSTLTPEDARRLMEIIDKLHQGIQKVEISVNDIRNVFNHPMTPSEIKRAFNKYVELIAGGYDNDNVRIILK